MIMILKTFTFLFNNRKNRAGVHFIHILEPLRKKNG